MREKQRQKKGIHRVKKRARARETETEEGRDRGRVEETA